MDLLSLLFPKKCIGCRKVGIYICSSCLNNAILHYPQDCPVCERASIDGITHVKCKKGFVPDGLVSLWNYDGVPKRAIGKFKYRFIKDMASEIINPLAKYLKETKKSVFASPDWNKDRFTIVPIPLFWMRENWRGFNQSEEMAKILGSKMGWKIENLLVRTKRTKSQVGLKEKERKENIEGVFSVPKDYCLIPTAQCLILFDDVWTTGSTMLEATKVLKQVGFKKVWCLTLAR